MYSNHKYSLWTVVGANIMVTIRNYSNIRIIMVFEYLFEYFSVLRIYSVFIFVPFSFHEYIRYSYSCHFQFTNIFSIRICPKINICCNTALCVLFVHFCNGSRIKIVFILLDWIGGWVG